MVIDVCRGAGDLALKRERVAWYRQVVVEAGLGLALPGEIAFVELFPLEGVTEGVIGHLDPGQLEDASGEWFQL